MVVGPDGATVEGALVAVVPLGVTASDPDAQTRPAARGRSDAGGRFRLEVPAGRYALTATSTVAAPAFLGGLTLEEGRTLGELRLTLRPGGTVVAGHVVGGGDRPLGEAELRFSRVSNDDGDIFYAAVNADGRYAVRLEAESYGLLALAAGHAQASRNVAPSLQPNLDLRLDPVIPGPAPPETVAWLRAHAIPLATHEAGRGFADLQPLRALIGSARLVALGEATHGTREFFQLKHRLLEFLVSELGFTVFAIEATMPEGFDVDEYVLSGKGDARKALSGLYFWTWNTEEVLELIEWMRRWNADPRHTRKVRFYGFDVQSPPLAARRALDFVAPLEPAPAKALRGRLAATLSPLDSGHLHTLPKDARTDLRAAAHDLIALFDAHKTEWVARTSADRFAVARQHARVLEQSVTALEAQSPGSRDRSMAENVGWILDREGPEARVVLWAHNRHVADDAEAYEMQGMMGHHLRPRYGRDMVVFGFGFNQGSFQAVEGSLQLGRGLRAFTVAPAPPDSYEAAFAATGLPLLALDLRALPTDGAAGRWLDAVHTLREVGARFAEAWADRLHQSLVLQRHFDAFLFVERTTAARANPGSARATIPVLAAPRNLDFAEGEAGAPPPGWYAPASQGDFGFTLLSRGRPGRRTALLARAPGRHYGEVAGTMFQRLDANSWRGKRVRATLLAEVRGEGTGKLFLRSQDQTGLPNAFATRRVEATPSKGALEVDVELPVAAGATALDVGVALEGTGELVLHRIGFGEVK